MRHSRNFMLGDGIADVETPDPVSMTVPDQTLSIRELIQRYARGLSVPMLQPSYSDEEFPDLNRMDLAEIQQMKENNAELIDSLKKEQDLILEELKKRAPDPSDIQDIEPVE